MLIALYNRLKGVKDAIQRQPAQTQQLEFAQQYITYGINDAFPLKLAKSIQDSVTASACLLTLSKFIRGSEFSDPDIAKITVNSLNETLWTIHCKTANSLGSFRGFALNIKYSIEGLPVEVYHVPFQYCRLGKPDDQGIISKIKYNPFFGTNEDRQNDTKEYDTFNPDRAVVLSQIAQQGNKYKGQIFYYGETTPLSPFYPYPVFASAQNWMNIEQAISMFHKENLDNGFFQSVLLRIIGDPTAESTHPDDQEWDETNQRFKSTRTVGDRFNIEMQKFSGAERVGNIMVQWGQNKDEWPDIQAFPTSGNQELFTALSTEAIDKIALAFGIPSILANVQRGATLGGDGNAVRVAVKLMQSRVQDDQKVLEQTYESFLKLFPTPVNEVKIVNYNPYPELDTIDTNIWGALTTQEKRKWISDNTNYPILEENPVLEQPQAKFSNALWTDYPEKAKANAKRAIEMKDRMECGTKNGWIRADEIAKGMPLPYKEVKRIYNYLKKNSWAESKLMNESCDALLFNAWGGKEMMMWAGEKIKSVEL